MTTMNVEVLLLTVTDVEAQTIREFAEKQLGKPCHTPCFTERIAYYDLGNIGNAHTIMVRSEMGSIDADGSLATVQESINLFNPDVVISVGIAFGMDETKQKIGQVLVSKQLHPYELQRIGEDETGNFKIIPRGPKVNAPVRVLSRFRAGALDWKDGVVEFGLLLSGSKLVDKKVYRQSLQEFEPEAIGGEMEGSGVYAAASRHKKDWIVVKAICDWADGDKSKNKKRRQKIAAEKSANFVFFVLKQKGFARVSQHPQTLKETSEGPFLQTEGESKELADAAVKLSNRIHSLSQEHVDHPSTIALFSEIDADIGRLISQVRQILRNNPRQKNFLNVESYLDEIESEMGFLRKEFAEASRTKAKDPFINTFSSLIERIKRTGDMLLNLSSSLLKSE